MIWQFQELGADQTTKNSSGGNDTGNKRVVWSLLNNANNKSLHESYRQLIHLRTLNPTLFAESAEATVSLDAWSGGRTLTLTDGSRELLLVVNPNVSGTADIYIPATVNPATWLFSTRARCSRVSRNPLYQAPISRACLPAPIWSTPPRIHSASTASSPTATPTAAASP